MSTFKGLSLGERWLYLGNILGIVSGAMVATGTLMLLADKKEIPAGSPIFGSTVGSAPATKAKSYFEI